MCYARPNKITLGLFYFQFYSENFQNYFRINVKYCFYIWKYCGKYNINMPKFGPVVLRRDTTQVKLTLKQSSAIFATVLRTSKSNQFGFLYYCDFFLKKIKYFRINVKYCFHIWQQCGKYMKMRTNKPKSGPVETLP